jgi:hypothetical protein
MVTLSYWRRRPLLLEGRVDEEVGDGESAAAA